MHALFTLGDETLCTTISTTAIDAAIHFVEVCCQRTAYIAGRGNLDKELQMIMQGTLFKIEAYKKIEKLHVFFFLGASIDSIV